MATLADLVLDTLELLYGHSQMRHPGEDTLAAAVSSNSDTTWSFAHNNMWHKDDYAEYWDGAGGEGEVVVLADNHDDPSEGRVRRAQLRTTAASSYSVGDVFLRNPPFPVVKVQRAINETIDNDLYPEVYFRTNRNLSVNTGRQRYPLNAADFLIEEMYQVDLNAESVGNATFADATDTWTLASHGLTVGDPVRFTAAGTNPATYAANTNYWVATVPTANTFTLSATESTTVLEGDGSNSDGTWTLQKVGIFTFDPLPNGVWEVVTDVDTTVTSSTGRALLLSHYYHKDYTVYYVARTKPQSSAVTSLPQGLVDLVPWGAASRLLAASAPPRRLEPRRDQTTQRRSEDQPFRDAAFFRVEFERMKQQYIRGLKRERTLAPVFKRRAGLVRRW